MISHTGAGHRFVFEGLDKAHGAVTEQMLREFVQLYYRWEDTTFRIVIAENPSEMRKIHCDPRIKNTIRGESRYNYVAREHTITLVRSNIEKDFMAGAVMGGDNFSPQTLSMAYAMVLVHEIQHANQYKVHSSKERFWNSRTYRDRACEREARQKVDESINEIAAYFGAQPVRRHKQHVENGLEELEDVVGLLLECDTITIDDVRDELRMSKILNPKNVQIVMQMLKNEGVSFEKIA
jgi:hypothetical protein